MTTSADAIMKRPDNMNHPDSSVYNQVMITPSILSVRFNALAIARLIEKGEAHVLLLLWLRSLLLLLLRGS